ncbi:pyridoxal phosphate-dependent aminotransferase [Hoyosella altamirensis]|uniref:N-succinyldiaminopimelate aminotransferase n=1 Tax=Hoyosella altamirensis TaxID=616997 RepID=A0A839RUC7_9ACTN|nr:pyridoxal phosphate-dependent aminotransferase [Hoyosella altamirensis]MBB3039411.1 N-succinyldiaminopimelate aminotransferase [Hoyosella altamirensis]
MLVPRLEPFRTTIFAEMTELAVSHNAINLGQGFPDEDGPAELLSAACDAIKGGFNQYPPGAGVPALREAISADREGRYGTVYDPDGEVLVTVGATEALTASLLALVERGDEVVLIEPYYDSYAAAVALAGARHRSARLVPDGRGFTLDLDSLRDAVTRETKVLVVNSPHNPTGTVLTASDLAAIAEIAIDNDLIVVTDEVYEHLLFDGRVHTPLASLPGMRERTLAVSSAGKTFSVTGWKIGWVCGPRDLVSAVRAAKQFLTFVGGGPFQPAVATALRTQLPWVAQLRATLQGKRDFLARSLSEAGLVPHTSDGTYFICADPRPLGYTDAATFCRTLPRSIGVAAVPVSAFTDADDSASWKHLVRFAFCKQHQVLDEAAKRLARLAEGPASHSGVASEIQ